MLQKAKISCHHGPSHSHNELIPTIKLLENQNEIDIIEIDFIYHNNQFISSHDYNKKLIKKGSELRIWIKHIIQLNKILWIDLKDCTSSIFFKQTSQCDVIALFNQLNEIELNEKHLKNHIIIGCQYTHIYNQLILNNNGYTIIQDLPHDQSYIFDQFIPIKSIVNRITSDIMKTININNDIIAIDKSFFDEKQLIDFINFIDCDIIIIYNYHYNEVLSLFKNKKIIYQYDY